MEENTDVDYTRNQETRWKRFLSVITSNRSLFYLCAFISSWDDRSWFFLVGIYLVALDPFNLVLTAAFGFAASGVVLLFGSLIGSWIDHTKRIKAALIVITIRNVSTLLSSVVLCFVFAYYTSVMLDPAWNTWKIVAEVCLIVFGVIAHVGGLVNNTILCRDWIAIFCLDNSDLLAQMTSHFRLIDLLSKILAPVLIGQIVTFAGKLTAAIFFSVQVLFSLSMLGFLFKTLYHRIPRLHYRENFAEVNSTTQSSQLLPKSSVVDNPPDYVSSKWLRPIEGWLMYVRQKIVFAGLGLALLYLTVLGFDTVTTGYALSQHMTESILSLFNAGAAITGILGALFFPLSVKYLGLIWTGLVAVLLQLVGLVPCGVSIVAPGSPFYHNDTIIIYPIENQWSWSLMLLMSGIVASRVGLWMFDLTVSQLLIETILEINRGKVNSVQNSLNMLFDMVKFALVLIFPLPNQFWLLVCVSLGAVMCGTMLYSIFALINHCRVDNLNTNICTRPDSSPVLVDTAQPRETIE